MRSSRSQTPQPSSDDDHRGGASRCGAPPSRPDRRTLRLMQHITSTSNARVKAVKALHASKGRRAAGLTLAEGPTIFAEAIASGAAVDSVFATIDDVATMTWAERSGSDLITVSDTVLAVLSDTRTPQTPVAIVAIPAAPPLRSTNTIVLHDVADPGNVGTILRSASAFGWDAAVVGSSADPWAPKSIRASAGSIFGLHVSRSADLDEAIRDAGLTTAVLIVDGGVPPRPQDEPIALFVGSEAHGLPDELIDDARLRWTLPMADRVESLNASVAASIAMYAGSSVRSPRGFTHV